MSSPSSSMILIAGPREAAHCGGWLSRAYSRSPLCSCSVAGHLSSTVGVRHRHGVHPGWVPARGSVAPQHRALAGSARRCRIAAVARETADTVGLVDVVIGTEGAD